MTHADDIMIAPYKLWRRRTDSTQVRLIGSGEDIRDWSATINHAAFFPYDDNYEVVDLHDLRLLRTMWPFRTELGNRSTISGSTYFAEERPWHEWHQLPKDKTAHHWSVVFAEVATYNHFVLDRSGKVFKQTAPVIKLPEGAVEDEHLALLGALNSSSACFWLKQACHVKGGSGIGRGIQDEAWEDRYAFNATRLERFPLPAELPLELSRALDGLAQGLAGQGPSAVCDNGVPTRVRLDAARAEHGRIRGRMIALQEELDW